MKIHLAECCQSNVTDVVILVAKEPSQYIDSQESQTVLSLDIHDSLDTLVEYSVTDVPRMIGVGGDLENSVRIR